MGWLGDFISTQLSIAELRYWTGKAHNVGYCETADEDDTSDTAGQRDSYSMTKEYNQGQKAYLATSMLLNQYSKNGLRNVDFNKTVKDNNPDVKFNAYPFFTEKMNELLNSLHKYSKCYEDERTSSPDCTIGGINSFDDSAQLFIDRTVDDILKEKHAVKDGKAFKLAMRYALTNDMFSAEEMIAKFKPELARKIINAMEIPDDEQDEEMFINMPEKTAYKPNDDDESAYVSKTRKDFGISDKSICGDPDINESISDELSRLHKYCCCCFDLKRVNDSQSSEGDNSFKTRMYRNIDKTLDKITELKESASDSVDEDVFFERVMNAMETETACDTTVINLLPDDIQDKVLKLIDYEKNRII